VVEEILTHARNNQLAAGSKLPSERELSTKLKVSRHTIREAYLTLAARGLVTIEQGRGVFLISKEEDLKPFPLVTDVAGIKNIVNLLEARQLIECGSIPLAMSRAVPEDYARLRQLIIAEEGRPYFHANTVIPSISFETEIVNLTKNQALINIENNIMEAWKNLWIRLKLSTLKPYARVDEHYEILDAMEHGDIKLAQKTLHAHLSSILLLLDRAQSV
jgi:GntR family transcriptional repressor for pyruvate dehydrogenase complex